MFDKLLKMFDIIKICIRFQLLTNHALYTYCLGVAAQNSNKTIIVADQNLNTSYSIKMIP